jgi:hypothetical protein
MGSALSMRGVTRHQWNYVMTATTFRPAYVKVRRAFK